MIKGLLQAILDELREYHAYVRERDSKIDQQEADEALELQARQAISDQTMQEIKDQAERALGLVGHHNS